MASLRAALAVALLLSTVGAAGADPLSIDHTATHEIGSYTHILRELTPGAWHHRSGDGYHCWRSGYPEPGADPDSVYFWPRLPRWAAVIQSGEATSWATTVGLSFPVPTFVYWQDYPGYVALPRGGETQRHAVAFVYLDPDGLWTGSWEWHIKQEASE